MAFYQNSRWLSGYSSEKIIQLVSIFSLLMLISLVAKSNSPDHNPFKYYFETLPYPHYNSTIEQNAGSVMLLFNKTDITPEGATAQQIHEKALNYNKLSGHFLEMGLYTLANSNASEGLVWAMEANDPEILFVSHNLHALSYEYLGNIPAAVEQLKTMIRLSETASDDTHAAFSLTRLIALYIKEQDTVRAGIYLEAANSMQDAIDQHILLHALYKLELLKFKLMTGDLEEAEKTHQNLIGALDKEFLIKALVLISSFPPESFYRQNMEEQHLLSALDIAEAGENLNYVLWIKELLAQYYQDTAKEKSLYYLQESLAHRQTIQAKIEQQRTFTIMEVAEMQRFQQTGIVKTKSKLLFFNIILLVILFSVIIFLLNRIFQLRKQHQNTKAENSRSQEEINLRIEAADSQIEDRISERIQVMKEELNERKKVDVELKTALQKAEDANYLKNAFLANISHEIRTPLNGILGFSNLLEVELALIDNPELFEYASSIQQSGERLLHLLNNIIDISRIEANDLEMKIMPHNVNTLISNAIELYAFKANEKGIRLINNFNQDLLVSTDSDTLTRVICEVLDNAIKYTEKGFIRIELVEDDSDGKLTLCIKDTGIGIDESYLPHIYEAFRQESLGYSRQYQGAGLGIPLAHRMMELMNGHIRIESQKSIGTTVYLDIPKANQQQESIFSDDKVLESKMKDVVIENLNILIVEDDRANMLLVKKMVGPYGNIHLATDGEKTLNLLQQLTDQEITVDIFLLDINLPAPWDGIKLLQAIKHRHPTYENSIFIAVTAYAMSGDKDRLLEAGFNDYIPKPIDKELLIQTIKYNWLKIT
jgi:signal transduction histidine kinase